MKLILSAGLAAVAFAGVAEAQIVTEWVLFQEPGDQAFTAPSSSAPNITGLNMTRGAGINPTAANNSISGNGWDTLAADDYFTFGFTVDPGFAVDLSELWLATRSSNTGPGFVGLYYSGDGFTTNLTTFVQVGTAFTNSIVDLSALTGLTGTVEFRVFSENSTSANGGTISSAGTLRIGEHFDGANFTTVRFTGSVVPSAGFATPYCFGDGSGTACPCGNVGGTGEGCANSTQAGAVMSASGSASVGAADLVLSGTGLVPGAPGLYFQGDLQIGGGLGNAFGDGLRCAGINVARLQVLIADGAGTSSTTVDIATEGGVTAGVTRNYQLWYRDPVNSPCGSTFNLSQGLEITWEP